MSEQEITLDDFNEHEEGSANNEIAPPTELAKIPIDWSSTRLDDVALDTEGAFVDGPFGSNLKANEMIEDGYARVVQLQNIRPSKFIDSNYKYINEEKFEELKRHGAEPGDLAIAKMAEPVARACLLPEIEDQYLVVADCIKLSVDESEHNSIFVLFALNSRPVWKQAFSRSRGSTRKRINLTQLKQVQIPSPPLPEQRKIATVLYTVDRAIEKTGELIEHTKRVQTGVEQRLFREGYFDHPSIEDTRLVTIPEGWDFDQLSKHTLDSAFGPRFGSERYDDEGEISTLRTTDLNARGHISLETMPVADLERDEIEDHLLKPDDFIITRSGTTGIGTVWRGYDKPTIPGAFLIRFRFEDTLSPEYMRYYVNSSIGRNRVNRRAKGGVQKNLAGSDLLNMRFPIPNKKEQRKIVEVLDTIEERINHERNYKSKLQRFKKGLMQDLLSGTVRTADTTIEVPDEIAQYG